MATSKRQKVLYEFGQFRLDPAERILLAGGESIALTPKAFDTLLLFVENSGQLLRKDELIEKLWPESFVGDNSLAQNISALRKALDEGSGQQHIETVPRLGYRFLVPVRKVEEELLGNVQPSTLLVGDDETAVGVLAEDGPEVSQSVPAGAADALPTAPAVDDTSAAPEIPVPASQPTVAVSPQRRRLITTAIVILGVLIVAALAYAFLIRKSPTAGSATPIRLAVLPFRNLKQDPETEFLSFSLADAVITKLGYVNTLIVRPSEYVDRYRNQTIDPAQVASELKIDLLLTGSFIKEGDDLRITTQLINVGSNAIVWRDTIDLKYDKLLTVQDELTAQVIRGLQLNLSPAERQNLTLDAPANALAYEYYLRGVDLYSQNNFSMAINMLEKAVSLDPKYALGWAQLGRAQHAEATFALGGGEVYAKSFASYEKALQLNPEQVEPRIFMANTYTDTGRSRQAIPLLRETLKAHPNQAEAHWELGYAYRFGGMLQESIQECERARQLDPKVKLNSSAINSYMYLGDYSKFLQSLPPTDNIAYIIFYRGFAHYYLKEWAQAAADFDRAYQLDPSLYSQVGAALSKDIAGHRDQGLKVLHDLERKINERNVRDPEAAYKIAQAYAVLGDKGSALRVLRRSIEGGFICYPYFVSDPLLESLRPEAEYATLIEMARQRHSEFKQEFFPQ